MEPTRRELLTALGAAGGLALTGCASRHTAARPSGGSTSPGRASTPGATPTPSGSPSPRLPRVPVWRPSRGDLQPGCKRAAVDEVLARGRAAGRRVEVVDAQYGGLLATTASVLVVTRSWRLVGDRVVRSGRTFDVRLSRAGGRPDGAWGVDRVLPSQPGPPARTLSAVARRVLASDALDLPPAARADVASGRVGTTALAGMLVLSRTRRLGISVVRSGHPIDVFGTDRPSDHPRGRAFDVWSIDGRAVVDPTTPRRLVTDLMRAAADVGAWNVGGPVLLGAPPQFFSDDTHHDHVHVGFRT